MMTDTAASLKESSFSEFVEAQRKTLAEYGFSSHLIDLQTHRIATGFEARTDHVDSFIAALSTGAGRLAATPEMVFGNYTSETLARRLRHLELEAEAIEAGTGMPMLKLAVGAIMWRDQKGRMREAPIWLRTVRIVGGEWIAAGSVEINEVFVARAKAAGLILTIAQDIPTKIDSEAVVISEDPGKVFAGVKPRAVIDLFATNKHAMWKTLDTNARPEILDRGAMRVLAGLESGKQPWESLGKNRHFVLADPTQDSVVTAARRGDSFIVEGPPGNGKSQTIANVVGNLHADGRRVLVAAEKVAAIEVVAARLKKAKVGFWLLLGQQVLGDSGAAVVLTTPAMAARHLPPSEVFDFLILDEAGQMALPAALSLASRAERMIVIGDRKQLGPSLRTYRPTEKATDTIELLDVLGHASALKWPAIFLAHHYRSFHPDLIFFSDVYSYGSTLMTSPSPHIGQNFGVFLCRVIGVVGDVVGDKKDNTFFNRHEAAAIVHLILSNIAKLAGTKTSLGIIVMNRVQRDLVASLLARELEKIGKTFADLSPKKESEEPFFVRTVEDVQGEERDVIIVGLTYARKPSRDVAGKRAGDIVQKPQGDVPVKMGPFSSTNCLAQMNVAMSRSRQQCYVVTSLQESDLQPGRYASHALFNALIRAADSRIEPKHLTKTHPLAQVAKTLRCRVQFIEGVFGLLHDRQFEDDGGPKKFILGVYLAGLRGEIADNAEISRLRKLGWRLAIVDAANAGKLASHDDYFATWRWPLVTIKNELVKAISDEGYS
jgi:hypothetical protein